MQWILFGCFPGVPAYIVQRGTSESLGVLHHDTLTFVFEVDAFILARAINSHILLDARRGCCASKWLASIRCIKRGCTCGSNIGNQRCVSSAQCAVLTAAGITSAGRPFSTKIRWPPEHCVDEEMLLRQAEREASAFGTCCFPVSMRDECGSYDAFI